MERSISPSSVYFGDGCYIFFQEKNSYNPVANFPQPTEKNKEALRFRVGQCDTRVWTVCNHRLKNRYIKMQISKIQRIPENMDEFLIDITLSLISKNGDHKRIHAKRLYEFHNNYNNDLWTAFTDFLNLIRTLRFCSVCDNICLDGSDKCIACAVNEFLER